MAPIMPRPKPALSRLSKSLALELAPHRITVNVICPGITDTAQPRGHQSEEQIYVSGTENSIRPHR